MTFMHNIYYQYYNTMLKIILNEQAMHTIYSRLLWLVKSTEWEIERDVDECRLECKEGMWRHGTGHPPAYLLPHLLTLLYLGGEQAHSVSTSHFNSLEHFRFFFFSSLGWSLDQGQGVEEGEMQSVTHPTTIPEYTIAFINKTNN